MTHVGVSDARSATAPARVRGTDVHARPPVMERLDASAANRGCSPEAPALPGRERASGLYQAFLESRECTFDGGS